MSDCPYIFDVSIENFQQLVLQNSLQVPVLVDFWADWCNPCKTLMPLLAKLAEEYQGAFLLAKVDTQVQQQLAAHFGVKSLPTVKVFRQGKVIDEFSGARQESYIRAIIDKHVVKPAEKLRLRAEDLTRQGKLVEAQALLTEANSLDPANASVLVDLARIHLLNSDNESARQILENLPVDAAMRTEVKQLKAQLQLADDSAELPSEHSLVVRLDQNPDDHEARFDLARLAIANDDVEQAMQWLIAIIQRDRQWNNEAAKTRLLQLFDLLGNADPRVAQYRRKLYALLH